MTSRENSFIQERVGLQAFDAIQLHHYKRVQYFLKNGLDPDLCDNQQRTLLMCACSISNEKTALKFCNLLLKHKARIEISDANGLNSLHYAVLNEHENIVGRFLEYAGNFDITLKDNKGNTALLLAVFIRNFPIVQRIVHSLRKYGLSVDPSNNEGITPLIQATLFRENEISNYLIEEGKASTEIRDKHFRKSARDWERMQDPCMYHHVLKGFPAIAQGTLAIPGYKSKYHNSPKSICTSTSNPTLKHAILRNPSQYIDYPRYITAQNEVRQYPKTNHSDSKENVYRYPDIKPVYNLYEQELASSYRRSAPPRVKTPPPPESDSSSERSHSWRKTLLSLKLKQRRHTISLSRSLPNNTATKNLFQRRGLPMAGTHARSHSLETNGAIFDSSKWAILRQNNPGRNSFRLPYEVPVPATAPGELESNDVTRRSSMSDETPRRSQRRLSVSFQSLIVGGNERDIPSQTPRKRRSSLKNTGDHTSMEVQPPILENIIEKNSSERTEDLRTENSTAGKINSPVIE